MKKLAALLCVVTMSGACTCSTSVGECIGVQTNKDPRLIYEASVWNIILAVIFSETIIVPLAVAFDSAYCPTATRETACCAADGATP